RPTVVHLFTPHDQHLPLALDVLDGGAHLLVEKPLAATVAAAKELTTAAERASTRGIQTGLVLQNRYNRPNQRLHELIASGGLGEVQDRKSIRLNSSHVSISYAVFCFKKKFICVILLYIINFIEQKHGYPIIKDTISFTV